MRCVISLWVMRGHIRYFYPEFIPRLESEPDTYRSGGGALMVYNLVNVFGFQGMVLPRSPAVLFHCWYIGAYMLFVLCYGQIQRVLRLLIPGGRLKVSTLFTCGAVLSAFQALLPLVDKLLEHSWAPMQLPTFALGALVGQACLKLQLGPSQRRAVAVAVDVLAVAVVVGSFT